MLASPDFIATSLMSSSAEFNVIESTGFDISTVMFTSPWKVNVFKSGFNISS